MLERHGETLLLPADDTLLKPGDRILFVGDDPARRLQQRYLTEPGTVSWAAPAASRRAASSSAGGTGARAERCERAPFASLRSGPVPAVRRAHLERAAAPACDATRPQ